MKHIFLINKTVLKKNYKDLIKSLDIVSKRQKLNYIIETASTYKKIDELIKKYETDENNILYAVGGDGTLNNLVNKIKSNNTIVSIIPMGTGNDFYRTLKQNKKGLIKIDLIKVNKKLGVNNICFGLDAEVANNKDKYNNSYIKSLIITYFKFKHLNLKIESDTINLKEKMSILSIANGGYYGGGFNVAPLSKIDDGLLDVVHTYVPKPLIPFHISKLITGKYDETGIIKMKRTNQLIITSDIKISANIDGEEIKAYKFEIECLKNKQKFYNNIDLSEELLKEIKIKK